ncbi:hypothetical protein D3C79_779370 [compost metagenome]
MDAHGPQRMFHRGGHQSPDVTAANQLERSRQDALDDGVQIAKIGRFNGQAYQPQRGQHNERRDQGREGFQHGGRDGIGQFETDVPDHQPPINLGCIDGDEDPQEHTGTAHVSQVDATDTDLLTGCLYGVSDVVGRDEHIGSQRNGGGDNGIELGIFLCQTISHPQGGKDGDQIIGCPDRQQQLVHQTALGHVLFVAGERQEGQDQEQRANDHEGHDQCHTITDSDQMTVISQPLSQRHHIFFNRIFCIGIIHSIPRHISTQQHCLNTPDNRLHFKNHLMT